VVCSSDHGRLFKVFLGVFHGGKDEAFSMVRDLIPSLQTELFKNAMRAICSENGTELKNTQFETFCASLGLER